MKNYKIITSPRAIQDVEDIADYIGNKLFAPRSAEKFIDKVVETYERLSTFPEMGTELKKEFALKFQYRWVLIDNYILFYTVKEDTVIVMRVLFSSRNYMNALE